MDSDATIVDKSITLEKYVDDTHELVVADAGFWNDGIFMIRNSRWDRAFMEEWRSISEHSHCYDTDNVGFAVAVLNSMAKDLGKPEPICSFGVSGTCTFGEIKDIRKSLGTAKPWDQGPTIPLSTAHILEYNAESPGGFNSGCGWGVNAYNAGNAWIHFAGHPNRANSLARIGSAPACTEGHKQDLSNGCVCSGYCAR